MRGRQTGVQHWDTTTPTPLSTPQQAANTRVTAPGSRLRLFLALPAGSSKLSFSSARTCRGPFHFFLCHLFSVSSTKYRLEKVVGAVAGRAGRAGSQAAQWKHGPQRTGWRRWWGLRQWEARWEGEDRLSGGTVEARPAKNGVRTVVEAAGR